MNNILKIMYDKLNREEKRKHILLINFNKIKAQKAGITNCTCVAVCANKTEYNQIKNNCNVDKYFDKICIFNTKKFEEFLCGKIFDVIIGNPPYYKEKPEGKKRAAPHLDSIIWSYLCNKLNKSHIIMIMSHGCSQMANMGYTYVSDSFQFPGAAIAVNFFERLPGEKEINIIKKYEKNGKYEWLKNNKLDKNKSLASLVVHPDIVDNIVPDSYFAYHERTGKNVQTFIGGDKLVKKNGKKLICIDFIKCKDNNIAKQLKTWFDENVTPKYAEFVEKFGDGNVNRGFLQTIEIPSFLNNL